LLNNKEKATVFRNSRYGGDRFLKFLQYMHFRRFRYVPSGSPDVSTNFGDDHPSQHSRRRTWNRVANEAEFKTRTKYACLTPIYNYVPVAVEKLSALGEEAYDFMHELGRRIAKATGERRVTE